MDQKEHDELRGIVKDNPWLLEYVDKRLAEVDKLLGQAGPAAAPATAPATQSQQQPAEDPTTAYMRQLRERREATVRGDANVPPMPPLPGPHLEQAQGQSPAGKAAGEPDPDPTGTYMRKIRERREALANRPPWEIGPE